MASGASADTIVLMGGFKSEAPVIEALIASADIEFADIEDKFTADQFKVLVENYVAHRLRVEREPTLQSYTVGSISKSFGQGKAGGGLLATEFGRVVARMLARA